MTHAYIIIAKLTLSLILFLSYVFLSVFVLGVSKPTRKEGYTGQSVFPLQLIKVMQQAVKQPKVVLLLQTVNIRAGKEESILHNYIKNCAL